MFRPSSRRVSPDPYAVLGISSDADVETILEARRTLAKRRHPDAGGTDRPNSEVDLSGRVRTVDQSEDPQLAST